jgi:hypothetical protein
MGQSSRAVVGPIEPSVGRPLDEGTDASGPRCTYGCACKSCDAAECHRRRYGIVAGDVSHGAEECDCLCHHWSNDDERH